MRVVADKAPPRNERAMHRFLICWKLVAGIAEFLFRGDQLIEGVRIVAGVALLRRIGSVLGTLHAHRGKGLLLQLLFSGFLFCRIRNAVKKDLERVVAAACHQKEDRAEQ